MHRPGPKDCGAAEDGNGARWCVAAMPHGTPATIQASGILARFLEAITKPRRQRKKHESRDSLFFGLSEHVPAVDRVREVLQQEGTAADMVEVEVRTRSQRNRFGFLGSPSIRVDGKMSSLRRARPVAFGMMCRTYIDGGQRAGVPPPEWIRAAVREARRKYHL